MSPTDEEITQGLAAHVRTRIVEALVSNGRRPDPAQKTAELLTPVFLSLLANPDVRRAALIATARMPI